MGKHHKSTDTRVVCMIFIYVQNVSGIIWTFSYIEFYNGNSVLTESDQLLLSYVIVVKNILQNKYSWWAKCWLVVVVANIVCFVCIVKQINPISVKPFLVSVSSLSNYLIYTFYTGCFPTKKTDRLTCIINLWPNNFAFYSNMFLHRLMKMVI